MIKIYIKQILKSYKKILSSFFVMLGIILSSYDIINIFLPKLFTNIKFNINELIILVIILLIISIIDNRPKLTRNFCIRNRDINIKVVVGDIFNQKGSKIIPTNTSFDTCMENEFISLKSIQGQFQNKYFKNNINVLDNMEVRNELKYHFKEIMVDEYQDTNDLQEAFINKIENMITQSLSENKIVKKYDDGRTTKTACYDVGTVAEINYSEERYYLLALADVNKKGTPIAKYDNIITSMQGLWDYLSENKHIDNLVIPIIGTGRAGIAEATRMRVIKEIILSFVAISSENKITDNLTLCIHPSDIQQNMVDIDEIFEYIEYTSKYRYEQIDIHNDGTPIG